MATDRKPLEYYLGLEYPFDVIADPDGGYVIVFPDLQGCMTQVETLDEIPYMVEDVLTGWLECEYDRDPDDIPLPSYPVEYSGKFNVRIPKSLHQLLVDAAERDGVSLNQYVTMLLTRGEAEDRTLLQTAQARQYARERASQEQESTSETIAKQPETAAV